MSFSRWSRITAWSDPEAERSLLELATTEEPWKLLERFAGLVRESGSEGERAAARYVAERLASWGIPFAVYEPELYLSLPRSASLIVEGRSVPAKTPSFSAATGPDGVEGELVYVPTRQAGSVGDIFSASDEARGYDLRGKIAVSEGFPMPGKQADLARAGAAAVICIAPGERIHEGICTPIWGAPDLRNADREPSVPVIAIRRSDGEELIAACRSRPTRARLTTSLVRGWMRCPIVVAEIRGRQEPDRFVLLHGHIDAWHVGIGDNATGDATLLEVARVLHRHRDRLRRSVRVAWWPGHSYGRYAGSTWYADRFAIDIDENCLVHVNCDSPGCRGATSYEGVMWSAEAAELGRRAIADATGKPATGARPLRAGDCSFNNIGVSTFFMLTSTIPAAEAAARGLYAVGGCGGNNEWHHEDDDMRLADRDVLLQDIRVYLLGVFRAAAAPVIPLDYRATVAEMTETIGRYQAAAGGDFDFTPTRTALADLEAALDGFYARVEAAAVPPAEANETQRRLARLLVPVNFTRDGRFWHDPALEVPPLPDLEPATDLPRLERGSHAHRVTLTHLQRGQNRVVAALREARRLVAQPAR
jgi:N-acetylated-alpha-linked acidic dipeptidase